MSMDIPPLQPGPKWVTGVSWWTSGMLFLPDDTMRCKRIAYIFFQQDAEPVNRLSGSRFATLGVTGMNACRVAGWQRWNTSCRTMTYDMNVTQCSCKPLRSWWRVPNKRVTNVTKGSLPRDIFFKKEDDEIYQWDVDTARTMNVSRSSLGSATDVMSPRNQNGRAGKSVNWTLSPHRNFSNISAPSEIFQIIFTGTYENCVSPLTTFWIQGFSRV